MIGWCKRGQVVQIAQDQQNKEQPHFPSILILFIDGNLYVEKHICASLSEPLWGSSFPFCGTELGNAWRCEEWLALGRRRCVSTVQASINTPCLGVSMSVPLFRVDKGHIQEVGNESRPYFVFIYLPFPSLMTPRILTCFSELGHSKILCAAFSSVTWCFVTMRYL